MNIDKRLFLLLFIAIVVVFWISDNKIVIKQQKMNNINEHFVGDGVNVDNIHVKDIGINTTEFIHKDKNIKTQIKVGRCPINEMLRKGKNKNNSKNKEAPFNDITKHKPPVCHQQKQTRDEFNDDFFKFRDYTFANSSMSYDCVDKINDMNLNGNLGNASNLNGMKIRDIYDKLTQGTDLYTQKCVRVPEFDNTMNNSYDFDFVTGLHNIRDNWTYPSDKNATNNIHARDNEAIDEMLISNYNHINK